MEIERTMRDGYKSAPKLGIIFHIDKFFPLKTSKKSAIVAGNTRALEHSSVRKSSRGYKSRLDVSKRDLVSLRYFTILLTVPSALTTMLMPWNGLSLTRPFTSM